jgi:hypothetical protein
MAGTTRLELATSVVTVQRPEATGCNFTAPIAALGALRNPRELLLHPNCTQIRGFSVLGVELLFGANGVVPVSDEHGWNHETQNAFQALTKDDIMIS